MKTLILLFFLILNFSCGTAEINSPSVENIEIDLNNNIQGSMSSLFDSIRYVLLEENDTLPLVRYFKTIIENDQIYVEDNQLNNLFKFDLNGKLISIIKSSGSGPKEFFQIEDFQVKNDTLIIQDNLSGKQIFFNRHGDFIKELKLGIPSTNFYRGNDFTLHFLNGSLTNSGKDFLRISDTGKENGFLNLNPNNLRGRVRVLHGFVTPKFTNTLSITIPFSYDVAFFDSIGSMNNLKSFSFLNQPLEEEIDGQIKIINAFFSFPNFYYMTSYLGRNGYQIILNKNFEPQKIGENLKNDFDGVNFYILPISFYENFLILYFPSSDIYNLYKNSEGESKIKYPKATIHEFVKNNEPELKNDRHVLVFLKIKNGIEFSK